MKSCVQAMSEYYDGAPAIPEPVSEAFQAGWDALAAEPLVAWCLKQQALERKLVALIAPTEAHDGPRYAGYYCEDAP